MSENTPDGQKLSKYLKAKGINRSELADKLGISRSAIYSYFATVNFTDEVKEKLKAIMNIDIDQLPDDDSNVAKEPKEEYGKSDCSQLYKIIDDYIEREKWLKQLIDKLS